MKTLLRAAKFLPSMENGYRANVFLIASMWAASSLADGGKSVGREKSGIGAVAKGREVAVGLLKPATAVSALDSEVVRVRKRVVIERSDETLSCMVVGGWISQAGRGERAVEGTRGRRKLKHSLLNSTVKKVRHGVGSS